MLNIPESVKTLYKTDGTRKNFRAHFPGGEMADITNANIVRESLHFTESLCSQNVFRFGLAEASVLEFESVGVGNMYGMTIQASIEIDVSSLTAAEIAEIEAGSWDGEYVTAAASDLGFAFFRVPLGVFRIEKCPRNHGAMTHRKVTAYDASGGTGLQLSPFEQWKQTVVWDPSFNALEYGSVDALVDSIVGYYKPAVIDGKYTKTALPSATSTSGDHKTILAQNGVLYVEYSGRYFYRYHNTFTPPFIYSVEMSDFSNADALAFIRGALDEWGAEDAYKETLAMLSYGVAATSFGNNNVRVLTKGGNFVGGFELTGDVPIMYFPDNYGKGAWFAAPLESTITLQWTPTGGSGTIKEETFSFSQSGTPFVAYALTPTNYASRLPISFQNTGTVEYGTRKYKTFSESYNAGDILRGQAELYGMFWKNDRSGGPEKTVLHPTPPVAIAPGDYDDCWWDEYDVSPIGTVLVAYKTTGKDATTPIVVGSGASEYDMTDNEILKNLDNLTYEAVYSLLAGEFTTNAANVGFTPIEMTMQSWPWLEAGDALQITAEDGAVVNTYALRVEMDGVQHLMATITAEGGEIVGET